MLLSIFRLDIVIEIVAGDCLKGKKDIIIKKIHKSNIGTQLQHKSKMNKLCALAVLSLLVI